MQIYPNLQLHEVFSMLIRPNFYEIIAAAILGLAYCNLRLSRGSSPPRLSFLAVFAALSVLLNPLLIHHVWMYGHFPYIVGVSVDGFHSFAAGVVALIAGIVAVIRIRKSKGKLKGLPFAIIGIVGGFLWAGAWAAFILAFSWGMAHAGDGAPRH
jgi:hypothetical protein